MVRRDTQRGIHARVGAVGYAEHIGRAGDDRKNQVRIVNRQLALQHSRGAVQSHAGVDGGPRQRRKHAARIAVELHEDQVPDFDVTVVAGVGKDLVFAARRVGFRPHVVEDLGTRAAGAGIAHLPEIVLFVEAEDAIFGDAGDLLPEMLGLVVLTKNGDVQAILGQGEVLGDQFPGEIDGIGFEVIAEGEIAQHFEEGEMPAGVADVFQVVMLAAGAHAFLRCRGAVIVAFFETEEGVLELVHAGVGEQQCGIVRRDERRTAHHAVAARGEEVEEALPDVVTCHSFILAGGRRSAQRCCPFHSAGLMAS
ncbi:MAG: hypothetical protein ABSH50_18985 [Bryobacteraceae bacterium]